MQTVSSAAPERDPYLGTRPSHESLSGSSVDKQADILAHNICLKSSRLCSRGYMFYECGHGNFHSRVSCLIVLFFGWRREGGREKGRKKGTRQSETGEKKGSGRDSCFMLK